MSNSPAGWKPAIDPIHKLIQLLDVLAISLGRVRMGLYRLPQPDSPEYTPGGWVAGRDRLLHDYRVLKGEIFPGEDIGPQNTATTLGDAAVAALAKANRVADEPVIREAQVLLGNLGCVRLLGIAPNDRDTDELRGLELVDQFLEQYEPVRQSVFGVLSRMAYAVPNEIRRRSNDAFRQAGSAEEERAIRDQLLNWVVQTRIPGDPPVLPVRAPVTSPIPNVPTPDLASSTTVSPKPPMFELPSKQHTTPTSGWDPAGNPVHRLVQLLDVLFITTNRSRQLLGFSPLAGSAIDSSNVVTTPEWWKTRNEVNEDTNWVVCSAFREEGVHAHTDLEQLACEGIARLRAEGVTAGDRLVEDIAQLLLDCIHVHYSASETARPRLFASRVVEWGDGAADDSEVEHCNPWVEFTARYCRLRAQLFRCLASAGQTVPVEIHHRADFAVYSLPPGWEKSESVERFVQWALDTLSPRELLDALIDLVERIWGHVRNALRFMSDETNWRASYPTPLDGTLSPEKENGVYFQRPRWWRRQLTLLCERLASLSVDHLSTAGWAESLRTIEEMFSGTTLGFWPDDPENWLTVSVAQIELLRAFRERTPVQSSPGGQGLHASSAKVPGKSEDEPPSLLEPSTQGEPAPLRQLDGNAFARVFFDAVENWKWTTGTEGTACHDLDLLLELADRVCTCVNVVASCGVRNPPMDHPVGNALNKRLEQYRNTVMAVNTHPHTSLQEWRSMVEAISATLEKGLRLTGKDDCESWRKTYLSQVSLVRSVRTRLSPVEPYTPTADPGSIRFLEQRGSFASPSSSGDSPITDNLRSESFNTASNRETFCPADTLDPPVMAPSEQHTAVMSEPLVGVAYRRRVQTVATEIETLAKKYADALDPIRVAVNAILEDAPSARLDRLNELCLYVSELDFSSFRYGNEIDRDSSAATIARHDLMRMIEAVGRNNEDRYRKLLAEVRSDAPVAKAAQDAFPEFAGVVLSRAYKKYRLDFISEAKAVLAKVAIELDSLCHYKLNNAGAELSPRASDALHHWVDPLSAEPWQTVGKGFQPIGWRDSSANSSDAVTDGTCVEPPEPGQPAKQEDRSERKIGRYKLGEGPKTTPEEQALRNVYELIRAVRKDGQGPAALFAHFEMDTEFKKRVKEAKRKFDEKLFRAALSWIDSNPV